MKNTTIICALAALAFASGCQNVKDAIKNKITAPPTPEASAHHDDVPYAALQWKFGGFNGDGVANVRGVIASLNCSPTMLTYAVEDLPLSPSPASTVTCLFFQMPDGSWVGGKFDWACKADENYWGKPRPLGHVGALPNGDAYNGWNMPYPLARGTEFCFVIVANNKSTRTHVKRGIVQ